MGLWDTVKSWFATEAESAREVAQNLESDWSAELDRREAELKAGPQERLESLQDRIADNTSSFDEIKAKIESTSTDTAGSDVGPLERADLGRSAVETDGPGDDRLDIVDAELVDTEPVDTEPVDAEPVADATEGAGSSGEDPPEESSPDAEPTG